MIIEPFYIYLYHLSEYTHNLMNIVLCISIFFLILALFAIICGDDANFTSEDKYNAGKTARHAAIVMFICYIIKALVPTSENVKNMILANALNCLDFDKAEAIKNLIDLMLK